jgi:tetratricopeptide (TPR) repeat protein
MCGHLGDAFEKLNRPEEALQAWRQALALNPKDARLQEKIKSRAPLGK